MATQTLQPGHVPANPLVEAYLAASANDEAIDNQIGQTRPSKHGWPNSRRLVREITQ